MNPLLILAAVALLCSLALVLGRTHATRHRHRATRLELSHRARPGIIAETQLLADTLKGVAACLALMLLLIAVWQRARAAEPLETRIDAAMRDPALHIHLRTQRQTCARGWHVITLQSARQTLTGCWRDAAADIVEARFERDAERVTVLLHVAGEAI